MLSGTKIPITQALFDHVRLKAFIKALHGCFSRMETIAHDFSDRPFQKGKNNIKNKPPLQNSAKAEIHDAGNDGNPKKNCCQTARGTAIGGKSDQRIHEKIEKVLFPVILTVLPFQSFAITENAVFLRNRLCARGIYRTTFIDHTGRIETLRIFGNDRENAAVLHVAKTASRFHSQMIIVIK